MARSIGRRFSKVLVSQECIRGGDMEATSRSQRTGCFRDAHRQGVEQKRISTESLLVPQEETKRTIAVLNVDSNVP